jgi:C4-dicarboxylate transporter DctQ subunit
MYERFDRALTAVENAIMLASYLILIFVVGVETLRRILTSEQAAWGPEVALYAFVWLSWFAMSSNTRLGRHLAFTEFRDMMPAKVKRAFEVFDCLLWFALGGIIMYTSIQVVQTNIRLGQVVFGTAIPLWAASVAVPLGWGFTMLRVLQKLWAIVRLPAVQPIEPSAVAQSNL